MRADFFIGIDFYHVAMVQLWQGLGVALFFMPILTILLSDLQQNEIASGSGLATFLRTLGGSFSAPSPRCCGSAARSPTTSSWPSTSTCSTPPRRRRWSIWGRATRKRAPA
jgi:hypothetical protein